jgi:subtilisin family serine protease
LREDSFRVLSLRAMRLALLLATVFAVLLAYSGETTASVSEPDPDYVTDELLVSYRVPLPPLAVQAIHLAAGAQVVQHEPLAGWYRIRLPQGVDPREAADLYGELPWVKYAEPNYLVRAALVPNDTLYDERQAWYYDLINAPAGWDVERGEPSVIVAVLDTGVDLEHPDLKDKIWTNAKENPPNGFDDDHNGCIDDLHGCNFLLAPPSTDPSDDHGHGTMVAGMIGARSNNGEGVAGVAWGVTLLPVKVLDSTGTGTSSDVAQGIIYAAKSGARVINMSMARSTPSLALEGAVQEAHDKFGAVLVSAAGNEGHAGVGFPAAYRQVIAVGSFDHNDPNARASFSNWGPEIAVAAPGVDVFSTYLGDGYAQSLGTSFSAAFVSGLAALLISQDPDRTDDDIRQLLRFTCDDLPDDNAPNWDGWGRMDIGGALSARVYQAAVPGIARQ